MKLCEDVGHCYMHKIQHATWFKYWCCQCEVYIDPKVPPPNSKFYKDGDLIDSYCVKCKNKKTMLESVIKVADSGRRMAQGKCETCGTKVNRILGRYGDYI